MTNDPNNFVQDKVPPIAENSLDADEQLCEAGQKICQSRIEHAHNDGDVEGTQLPIDNNRGGATNGSVDFREDSEATACLGDQNIEQASEPKSFGDLDCLALKKQESSADSKMTLQSLVVSAVTSLGIVVVLLIVVRLILPSAIELTRYSWHRGQLRAEYEHAGDLLKQVSLDDVGSVSRAVGHRVLPSVVQILNVPLPTADSEMEVSLWDALVKPRNASGHGSGVIIDAEGHVLTNSHVVEPDSIVLVYLADERLARGRLIARDSTTDLALIKIEADGLMPVKWGDSDSVQVGAPVWAVGSPFGLKGSLTFGIVSSKHRLDLSGTYYDAPFRDRPSRSENSGPVPRYSDLMQTDVAVNPGNSGGPLVNAKGELIGINTAIVGESYRGVSFAIPSNVAKRVVDEFKTAGKVRRGWLGVELIPNSSFHQLVSGHRLLEQKDEQDIKLVSAERLKPTVHRIVEESPAAKAGLRKGDVVLSMDSHPIATVEDAIFKIGQYTAGAMVKFLVLRDGIEQELLVELGLRPE